MVLGNYGGMSGLPNDLASILDLEHTKQEIIDSSKKVQLILPTTYNSHEQGTLPYILTELNKCDYLDKVNLPVFADEKKYTEILSTVRKNLDLPYRVTNCSTDEVKEIMYSLIDRGSSIPVYKEEGETKLSRGKGRDVWLEMIPSTKESDVVVLHDADITPKTYSERIPTSLAWPLTASDKDFEFVKGHFYRVDEERKIHGRVCRLFVEPLIKSLQSVPQRDGVTSKFLKYLDSFPYPLSGEIGISSTLARNCSFKPNYGLEIGTLKEVFNNTNVNENVFLVGLLDYNHNHQSKGSLENMCKEIQKTLFTSIAERNPSFFSNVDFKSLETAYLLNAKKSVERWDNIRHMGNFNIKRSEEDNLVNSFTNAFREGCEDWEKGDRGTMELPTIESVTSHMPTIADRIRNISLSEEGN